MPSYEDRMPSNAAIRTGWFVAQNFSSARCIASAASGSTEVLRYGLT